MAEVDNETYEESDY